jgi:hypothetical protein
VEIFWYKTGRLCAVSRGVQRGHVYVGLLLAICRERNELPGWNLAATAAGTASLLTALDRLPISHPGAQSLACAVPDGRVLKVPNNGTSPVIAVGRVRLVLAERPDEAQLVEEAGEAILGLTLEQVGQMRCALRNPSAAFDTPITEDPDVWYWGVV